jgi:hypothetical protein
MAYLVNRHMLRGISVFCEPPQKPINRGVHVERKFANSLVSFRAESNRYFLSFSVSLPNSVSVEKRKLYVVDV